MFPPDHPHIEIAYDIDPLTPLGPTPDPIPADSLERGADSPANPDSNNDPADKDRQ